MLDLLFGPSKRAVLDGTDLWGPSWAPRRTAAGMSVSDESALTYNAVICATRIICEAVSMLPLFLYKRDPGGGRSLATDHYLYDIVTERPNDEMDGMVFREGRVENQVNLGNGFAEIERNRRGEVVNLWPIHAHRVRPVRPGEDAAREGYAYYVRNNDGSSTVLRKDEMLHFPGVLSADGVWGKSLIDVARETIGFGLAVERHGAVFFGSGAHPRGILKGPGMRDPEARANFRREWKAIHGSPDSGEIAIIPTEADFTPITISNENSQFLQTQKFNIASIARIYRVPVYMLEEYEKAASYASVEMRGIDFVRYHLMPWLIRWEGQLNLKLLTPEERRTHYFKHQVNSIQRGDYKTRTDGYRTLINIGVMSINEVRELEEMNSIGPAGDQYFFPLNMTTVDAVAAGPVQQAPSATLLPMDEEEEDEDESEASNGQAASVAKAVLADALRRMFTKEANAAQRAASNKKLDFDVWLEEFYATHKATMVKALGPAALALMQDAGELASRIIAESKGELREAFNRETREQFQSRLASWPTARAERTAEQIIGS